MAAVSEREKKFEVVLVFDPTAKMNHAKKKK
jgi:hypothetical protein